MLIVVSTLYIRLMSGSKVGKLATPKVAGSWSVHCDTLISQPGCQIHAAELALRHAVAIEIGPRYVHGPQRQRVVAVREAGRARLLVSPDAELQRRLLVSEQVVHHSETWRDALPGWHVHRSEAARPPTNRPRPTSHAGMPDAKYSQRAP